MSGVGWESGVVGGCSIYEEYNHYVQVSGGNHWAETNLGAGEGGTLWLLQKQDCLPGPPTGPEDPRSLPQGAHTHKQHKHHTR